MDQPYQQSDIPMGLGMALIQNKPAFDYFTGLSEEAKQEVIDHTHTINSKDEMQSYVDSLAKKYWL